FPPGYAAPAHIMQSPRHRLRYLAELRLAASRMRWSSSFSDFDHPEYPPLPTPKNRFRPTMRLRFCRMAMTGSDIGILCSHLFLVRDGGNVNKPVLKSVSFTRSKAPISSRRCRVNTSNRTISL